MSIDRVEIRGLRVQLAEDLAPSADEVVVSELAVGLVLSELEDARPVER